MSERSSLRTVHFKCRVQIKKRGCMSSGQFVLQKENVCSDLFQVLNQKNGIYSRDIKKELILELWFGVRKKLRYLEQENLKDSLSLRKEYLVDAECIKNALHILIKEEETHK